MNHVYQALWCAKDQTWKAVPETARRAHKGSGQSKKISISNALVGSVLLGVLPSILYASQPPPAPNQLPVGGQVVQGTATISQTATAQAAAMTIQQVSQRAVINWNSFSLGQSASVQFNQPSAQAVTLNRITGADPSQIFGKMTAPGQVFVVNPAGVYFSPTASVDVGGLVASTHSISDEDFMGGRMRFERNGASGAVVNQGTLTAALGGYIALLAPEVRNQGVVIARAGSVAMASGETITLNFDSSQRLTGISTTPSAIASLVDNQQAVMAPDGYIILSAVGLSKLQAGVVRNSGSLEASSLVSKGGKIVLEGDTIGLASNSQIKATGASGGGTVLIGGDWQGSGDVRQATKVTMEAGATIDASATDKGDGGKVVLWSDIHNAQSLTRANGSIKAEAGPNGGNGGQIETSSHWLDTDGIQVSTKAAAGESGIWLLDPYDVTISSGDTANATLSAGVYTPSGNNTVVKASTLRTNLNSTSIEISTTGAGTQAGNIDITADISWTQANTLKLTASGSITSSNSSIITASAAGARVIFNQAGNSTFSGKINDNLALTKQGVGTLTLTGANTFWRGISLERGNIVLGDGGLLTTSTQGNFLPIKFNNTVDESAFVIDKSSTYVLKGVFSTTASTVPGVVRIAQGTVQTSSSQLSGSGAYIDIAAGATLQKTDSSAYISIVGLRGSGNLVNPTTLSISTKSGITSTFSGIISGANDVAIRGPGVQVFSGANTYTGPTLIDAGATLRVSNASALGTSLAAGKTTVSNLGTLEIDGGITVAEPLTLQTGAIIRSVSGVNVFSGVLTPNNNPNLTFKVDAGSLNFSDTATQSLSSATWNFFLTGNLNFASAVNGGTLKKIGAGNLTYLSRTGTAVANATGVYVRLYDPTGNDYSSNYGSTPDFSYAFYDAAEGGNLVSTAGTGTAAWTGTKPTASSIPATYSLTYASGISPSDSNLVAIGAGASANWTVVPKPITITLTRPDITYNGITSYANLTSGASYTSTAMVGTDKLSSFTRTATLAGGGAALGIAQGGTYTITPSNAVMGAGVASNYSFTYTPVTGTVLKAPLTMAADNASVLLGQSDPAFTASYSGFVNGETSVALTSPTVTRFGVDSAAGTYANVLRPSASSNNYNITTVNGAFTVVPADTLLIKIANSNNTYGSAPSYSVTSAEYLTGANVLRTVNVTPTGGGHFTYTDGVVGGATTGAFDLVSAASANSDVNNYAISLANFTKVGNNFTSPTPVTQAGNLAVVPLAVTVAAPVVSKVYDGTIAATGVADITNKLAGDDVSLTSVGQYTDDANVGAAHAFTLFGFTVGGTKASNYVIDPANLPNLTGNDGAITPAALTLSTSNVVKTYNGSLSVAGAATAPALTVTAGTLFTNVSNSSTLDSVSGGTFAFTNANAGTGNKTVTVTGATVADGNAGGNYTITYANNTTSTITPAALTLSTSNVVKTYNGNVSVAGATTAPTLTVASGSLFTNASNGNALDSVSGGTFAFTSAAAGTSNKTVTVTGATLTDGNAGGNYTITYANNTTSTINQKTLTASMSAANKTYDGTTAASVTGSSTDIINGDSVSFANTSATFNTQNVGTGKTVTIAGISLSGADAGNYSLQNNTTTASADISKKDVVLTSITAADKTYDGTTTDSITSGSITTGVGTETLGISGTGTFSDKNVATGKTVTVADVTALTKTNGTGAWSNYNLTTTGALTTTAAISKSNLAMTATATDKVYDTTNAAAASLASNMISGDSLTLSKTSATFSDKNVGIGKTVTVAGLSISGTDAGNYNLTNNSTTTTATISKANLAITATATDKVYDTSTAATASLASDMLLGDSLTLSKTGATFSDKNVGTGKTVTVAGLSISGTDAGNYNLTNNSTATTATISKATLAITATATDKVYDTSTAATASLASDMLLGDSLTLSKTGATFSDKNVGTGKTVTVAGLSISGTDAGNYNLTNTSTNATASISQAALSITATQVTKTYDGGLSATGNATVGALAGLGDSVSNTGSQAFIDKNVGTGKTVTASGVSIKDAANADMTGNYNITYVANNTSVVNRAALSITANADARFATQTDAANFNGVSYSGFVGGDTSAVLGGALAISRTNALTDVAAATYNGVLVPTGLTASNYTIGYTNGNYTIVPADRLLVNTTSQAVIYGTTPTFTTTAKYLDSHDNQIKVLTQTGTNNNYTYNDGAGTTISLALKPYTGATVATLSSSNNTVAGTYDVKDTAYVQNGTNFNGTPVFVGTLTVDQKAITPSATGVSKVYDGTTTMGNVVIGMTGKVANDNVTISGNGAFSQKNVGANLGYAISGITLASADAGNYYLSGGVNSFSGNDGAITVAPLVITSGNVSKVYDRTTAAAGVAQAATGSQTFGSDSLSGGTFAFTSAAAGAGNKTVTVSGVTVNDGNSGNNYAVTYANNTTSTISPAALTISGITASNKVYDASADATVSTAAVFKGGLIAGDVVNVSATGLFADKNVGLAKTVTLTSTYTGADVTNYTITGQASANANITAKAITVTGVAANDKVYDASTAAVLNLTGATLTNGAANTNDHKFYSADSVTLVNAGASGAFANANVGIAKAVAVSGFTLTGTDAGNYSVTDASSASASISAKALTVSGLSAPNSKVYDGSRSAVVTSAPTLLSAQAAGSGTGADGTPFVGDTIHFVGAASATYNTKDAASANTVTFAGLTSDNPNYTFTLGTQAATITPKALTISGITAADRIYDGTSQATVSSAGVTNAVLVNGGLVSGDAVTVAASGVFRNALNTANDANVAANKTVALTSTYSGADVSNYTITGQATTQANVTVHPVTLSASKSFDGSDDLTGYVTIQTGVANEDLRYSGARANFSDTRANNFIVSIVLNDGTGIASNYVIPSLDAGNAPVAIRGIASNNSNSSASSRSDSEYFRAQAQFSRMGNSTQLPLFVDTVMASTNTSSFGTSPGAAYSAGVTVDLVNAPSARVSGFVAVQVPRNMSTQGAGLIIPLPAEVKEGVGPNSDFSIRMPDNSPLPSWIRYSSEIHAIVTGAVPEGAFPMQILVFSGGKRTLIQISENQI